MLVVCIRVLGLVGPAAFWRFCEPRSSVALAVCWCAGSEACVEPCALRDHKHAFVLVK